MHSHLNEARNSDDAVAKRPSNAGDADFEPVGASRASARRLLIIGLDGATFDVLDPLMQEGRMPRLSGVTAGGASGILCSTTPAITPAAWTTFLTGRQPGSHGIIDFEAYEPTTNRFMFNSSRSMSRVRTIFEIAGDAGLRVGSVNVPMTYPAMPVNGFMVSGFETPGPDSDFVYPQELKSEILDRWPDPTLRSKWRHSFLHRERVFGENIDYMSRSFHQGAEMSMWLGDRFGWDVLMVVFKLVDNLQHKTWKYIDARWADRHPRLRELVKGGFAALDAAVGTLLDYAARHEAGVLMVSDHGHGSLEGKVHPNTLLKRWGYLSLARGPTRTDRAKPDRHIGDVERALPIDYAGTKAAVMHAGNAGFLYINLKGRQPTGIVPSEQYEALRDELRERFLGDECRVTDPRGRSVQLFTAAHRPEELYGCSREAQPWMPDLILIPHEPLAVVRKIRGRPVRWLPYRRIEGTHRPEGIIISAGPGIARTRALRAHIVDCAPTILGMLGLPVPADLEGRVITEMFETAPVVRTSAASPAVAPASGDEPVYSEEELQQVTDRLSDLGYLE